MANCNDLVKGLDPTCDALNKVGGVNKRVWIGQLSQITGYSKDGGTDDISGISMAVNGSIPFTLKKFISKRDKIAVTFPLSVGENINTFNHTLAIPLYYSTTQELNAIKNLCNADDLFVVFQDNNDELMVAGIELGLNASAGEGGTGILLNDATSYMVTLSGEQKSTPKYFNISSVATLAQNIAYLDAISE